jgi:hypothetical protein
MLIYYEKTIWGWNHSTFSHHSKDKIYYYLMVIFFLKNSLEFIFTPWIETLLGHILLIMSNNNWKVILFNVNYVYDKIDKIKTYEIQCLMGWYYKD